MKNSKINNTWYIYQNDVYGVNGLITCQSKEDLMKYIISEEFIAFCVPEGIEKEDHKKIQDLTQKFGDNKITHKEYAQKLLEIFVENDGEIDEMHIEDFESLCTGMSEFSQSCIGGFYSEMDVDEPPTQVPENDKADFKNYFDTAEENWIG